MANPNPNTSGLQPFKKGNDPRRNLRGVPKDAIAARKFFRRIGAELLTTTNGEELTRLEAMVRLKFGSKAPKDFETILKAMFPGLLKDEVDLSNSDGSLTPPPLPDEERLARMKQLAVMIAEQIKDKNA